jgi:hypothetical protein
MTQFDALAMLREASERHGIHLSVLVAETALWTSPELHRRLLAENGTGAVFPGVRRYRAGKGERRSEIRDGERLDDNTYANHGFKQSLGLARGDAVGFEVCHIWPQSCYDSRYHTVVANLVLLPRPLAGLTDHDPEIQGALQFRSFELYKWYPADSQRPTRPAFYPSAWRDPQPFTTAIAQWLGRRKMSHLAPDA